MKHRPEKILYVITKGNFGGAQRYVFDLAREAKAQNYEAVVACGDEGESLREKLAEEQVRVVNIPGFRRDLGVFSDVRSFFALSALLWKEDPNIVHLNSSKAGFLGALAARVTNLFKRPSHRARIIFTGHGWAFNESRPGWQKSLFFFLHWVTIVLSHATIAVSERTADQVRHLPFVKLKVTTIYNGIESFPLASQSEARHVLAPETHERVWIGTVSELHDNKGIDLLLEAFALLAPRYANIALVIVGTGEKFSELQELATTLGIETRVHFAGFKPEARAYLKAFDIFVLPSRTEAFPYALLEAGIAELAVVASWAGGIPELITNGTEGVLVNPVKREEFASVLETFIVDQDRRTQMAHALHAKVSSSFYFSKMIESTYKLYQKQGRQKPKG